MIKIKCKICGNEENSIIKIRDKMFYLGESFDYLECSKCGILQIEEIPADVSSYYPKNYYSFESKGNTLNWINKIIRKKRNQYYLFNNDLIGKIATILSPNSFFEILGGLNLNVKDVILDVGCGDGYFLFNLKELNFKYLVGIDPYIEKDNLNESLRIFKKNIHQMNGDETFNVIIFNHSFEHIEDQIETLKKASSILSPEGLCIIRMPVKTEYIWKNYGANWVQLDAPRHFFIHTIKSFKSLINMTDLYVDKLIFDSNEFQFWGSEQYKKDIPLISENSYLINPKKSIFSKKDIKMFKMKANALNKIEQGDQATFILKKVKS